ncbi:MAG: hypothetical protein J6C78_01330 [Muribaculaceae bacterium]|nr:hypothetical protein [Muribaculaceae bacterium]
MVTKKVIESIYKKYSKRPDSPDELDIPLLFEYLIEPHKMRIDDDFNLIIGSIDPNSPFHIIDLNKVHGIVEFDNSVAIVLHSSIIFLNKHDKQSHIHIKLDQPSFLERLRSRMSRDGADE